MKEPKNYLTTKEAKAALAIGLCVIVKQADGEWGNRAIWKEGERYKSYTKTGLPWDVTVFVNAWFEMGGTQWSIVPKDYCPQDDE